MNRTSSGRSSWCNKCAVIKSVIIALLTSLASARRVTAPPFLDNVRLAQDKSNTGSVDSDEQSPLSSLSEASIDYTLILDNDFGRKVKLG